MAEAWTLHCTMSLCRPLRCAPRTPKTTRKTDSLLSFITITQSTQSSTRNNWTACCLFRRSGSAKKPQPSRWTWIINRSLFPIDFVGDLFHLGYRVFRNGSVSPTPSIEELSRRLWNPTFMVHSKLGITEVETR